MDWRKIKAEYIAGGTSYRKLADKYGVPFSTLSDQARREKWTEMKRQTQYKSNTKMVETIGAKNGTYSVKILDVADKLLDKISDTLDTIPELSSSSLKNFTSALRDLKDIRGLKSEMDIREQEARIEKLKKDAQEEKKARTLTVTFAGGVEKYGD